MLLVNADRETVKWFGAASDISERKQAERPSAVTREASDGAQVLETIWKDSYDLALLDISMPGKNRLEVLKVPGRP